MFSASEYMLSLAAGVFSPRKSEIDQRIPGNSTISAVSLAKEANFLKQNAEDIGEIVGSESSSSHHFGLVANSLFSCLCVFVYVFISLYIDLYQHGHITVSKRRKITENWLWCFTDSF